MRGFCEPENFRKDPGLGIAGCLDEAGHLPGINSESGLDSRLHPNVFSSLGLIVNDATVFVTLELHNERP